MTVAQGLDLRIATFEGHASNECSASAALVTATADDEPLKAAVRIVAALLTAFEEEGEDLLLPLQQIHQALADLQSEQRSGGGLLGLYLKNVRAEHSNLIPLSDDVSPLIELDRVYVKLELAAHEHAVVRKEGLDPFAQAQEIRRLLELDRSKYSWLTHRWVVRGDPGSGKTTLLRHLAWSLSGQTSPRWIPVFTSLPRWTRTQDWILDRVERNLLRAGKRAKGIAAQLDRHGDEGRLLVLLDGLDEVGKENLVEVETLLREVSQRWPKTPLVVTSRPIGYRRPGNDFLELDILPLDSERQKSFLARWFGRRTGQAQPGRAAEVHAALEAGTSLGDLAKNPLYLTLIAWLVEDGQPLEHRRVHLYDQVFRMLLLGKHRPSGTAIECRDTVREVLQQLAFAMTIDNTDAEPVGKIERRLYQPRFDRLRHELERVPRWDRHMGQFLEDLSKRTGVLGPHDGGDADWRFWHRTFREALAAEALEHLHKQEGPQALLEHAKTVEGDESRWAEPFALLAGRIQEADELVKTLVRENSALGLRALATAQGLKAETLREVMALSADWRERRKVYEEIPNQLGDPESALTLLDQIRSQTKPRNGNDLFFIDQTMAALGKESPDLGRRVEALRGRLFDHLESPPAGFFEAIETPHGGRGALWCEVPKGEFFMGSPEDEEERYDDEGPQHRVVITAPFRLAASPVTQGQYAAFDPEHVSNFDREAVGAAHVDHPVEGVTWYAAVMFCRWLSTLPGLEGSRLPTEEEWEYACRASSTSRFWSGDSEKDLADVGWFDKNSEGRTHRVGEKRPNGFGLYDMHGNVDEWTLSLQSSYKDGQPPAKIDPTAGDAADLAVLPATAASDRVFRGGSCWDSARVARSAFRFWNAPGYSFGLLGFRVLLPSSPRL